MENLPGSFLGYLSFKKSNKSNKKGMLNGVYSKGQFYIDRVSPNGPPFMHAPTKIIFNYCFLNDPYSISASQSSEPGSHSTSAS